MPNSSPVTLTTSEGYYETYDSLDGTSMATPHVAGVAGLGSHLLLRSQALQHQCLRPKPDRGQADQISGLANY
jgi:hypothetical protein